MRRPIGRVVDVETRCGRFGAVFTNGVHVLDLTGGYDVTHPLDYMGRHSTEDAAVALLEAVQRGEGPPG